MDRGETIAAVIDRAIAGLISTDEAQAQLDTLNVHGGFVHDGGLSYCGFDYTAQTWWSIGR